MKYYVIENTNILSYLYNNIISYYQDNLHLPFF